MDRMDRKPTILERIQAFELMESCFHLAGGDIEVAKELFKSLAPNRGIDPALVSLLIQLLLPILLEWLKKRERKHAEA